MSSESFQKTVFLLLLIITSVLITGLKGVLYDGWFSLSLVSSFAYLALILNKVRLQWVLIPLSVIAATTHSWSIGVSAGFICLANVPVSLLYYSALSISLFFAINPVSVLRSAFSDFKSLLS